MPFVHKELCEDNIYTSARSAEFPRFRQVRAALGEPVTSPAAVGQAEPDAHLLRWRRHREAEAQRANGINGTGLIIGATINVGRLLDLSRLTSPLGVIKKPENGSDPAQFDLSRLTSAVIGVTAPYPHILT